MRAYKQGDWGECTKYFQSAIDDYHFVKDGIIDCRLKCKQTEDETNEDENIMDLHVLLLQSNCLRICKHELLGDRAEEEVSYVVDKKFEDRTPYNFVQFCYFKDEKYKQAAAATYTYYITHQDDEMSLDNIHYYKTLPGVEDKDFEDLERKPYQTQYVRGLQAYNAGDWEESASGFESALELYFVEEKRCRAGCEKFYSHSGQPDFINAVADHYVTVLVCQQICLRKLSTFGMEQLDDFVAEHYNYLQYAYYESNNLEKAFQSIANYLLIKPHNNVMLENKDYYIRTLRHKEEAFKPSKEVVDYVEMWRKKGKSLDFIRVDYILPGDEIQKKTNDEEDGAEEKDLRRSKDPTKRVMLFEKLGINLIGTWGSELNNDRFITDGFIRSDQCEALADLARSRYEDNNGFKKINVAEATKLVKDEDDYEISLRLLLRAIDIMKAYSSVYFNQSGLMVKDVQVVCSKPQEDNDLDKIDECILQETGGCKTDKESQEEEFMLISYLTDIHDESGLFYFIEENAEPSIEPICGRVVGFRGHINHGVKLAKNKERCTVVMTFTTNNDLLLKDISEAKKLVASIDEERLKAYREIDNTDILQQFYSQGVSIVQKGEDLHGKERFVSDGLSTQKECSELIDLAKHGILGNGYHGRTSPHTDNELFAGLDVARAEQLMQEKVVSASTVQLLLDVSEHSRLLVEKYFNLTKPLYFDYTHLVCRTALDVDVESREADLSHPVHSDNCMIQPDGSCIVDPLAYAQRHYSAIMYLNDDFEGGEFFFAHNNKSEQISLSPKCGRLVAFNAGEYHGVKAVTKGKRCAIAMWYTHKLDFVEVSRLHAQRTLDKQSLGDSNEEVDGMESVADLEEEDESFEENHDEL
ncbi:procollagen-proline 3-dioxygenase [Mactra antiquata]